MPNEDKTALSPNIAGTLYRELRRQILSGELSPGDRLPGERELAQRYETNRNTLREAVRMLEQARLVTVRHGQGVTICDFKKTGTLELLPPYLENATDPSDVAHLLEDILPARLLVLEFAAQIAARRADKDDIARLRDITDLMIAAFERADLVVIAHGFQRWLDALIDSGHSVAVRWIANPFLDAYRELMDRFPGLWVLEPSFPQYLREFNAALESSDTERAVSVSRAYYQRVDGTFMQALKAIMSQRKSGPFASAGPLEEEAPNEPRH